MESTLKSHATAPASRTKSRRTSEESRTRIMLVDCWSVAFKKNISNLILYKKNHTRSSLRHDELSCTVLQCEKNHDIHRQWLLKVILIMSPDTLLTALPMAMSHNWYQRANCTEFLGDFPTVSTKTNIRLVHQTKFIRALKQRPYKFSLGRGPA
jgi:hypothetical protein